MLKSISQIIKSRESEAGSGGEVVANTKVIRNPDSGNKFLVPGHVSDFIEQDGKTKTEFNPAAYASHDWNWKRKRIMKTKKVDSHFNAVEEQPARKHKLDSD